MSSDVLMPRLSDSMEEGTILAWLKQRGDEVAIGEELVEIETDKANMVFAADATGTLTEILAEEGETLPIGAVIARIGAASEDGGAPTADAIAAESEVVASGEVEPSPVAEDRVPVEVVVDEPPAQDRRLRVSPLARRIAVSRGIDLTTISGSGPGGRIVRADVEPRSEPIAPAPPAAAVAVAAPTGTESAKGAVERIEPSKLQATVARRMAESKATAPHFYVSAEIDMSEASAARARLKEAVDGNLPSFNDMVVKASAIALREFPRVNASYRDGGFELYSRVNVGIAVAAQDALVVPTIFDADRKGLREIADESRWISGKVRDGTITPPELSGGTFTVSNLGMYGMSSIGPVINPPQAAILGVGEIRKRPVVRGGDVIAGMTMNVTLAADHRILYGADAAAFVARIRTVLEDPFGLAL